MASPAAVLSILVEANTGAANANLAKTDAALRGTAAAGTGATTATSKASSAMKKMGTVAKYAGAAIGVAFVIEAKKAVTTTQDLTKSTLSLHKNLGLSNKAASEWAGLAKARGADTTKLGMAFKTLASQISAAGHGSATSIAMFKELGFSQKDIQKSMTDTQFAIGKVSDGLNELPAGADKATFSSKLFGRGWQTIAPILRDGSAAMQEQLDTVEKYGGVLQGKTLKQQEDLLANIRENKIAWQGFQVTLASAVTPALNTVSNQFQHMAAIMADPKLTDDAKFKKVADILEKDFSRALDVIVKLIPTIASRVGEQAPKIALALVNGFINADIWGKLLLGTWLANKFLKTGVLVTVGKKAGLLLGRAFAASTLGSMVIEKLGLTAIFGTGAEGKLSTTGTRAGSLVGKGFALGLITLGTIEIADWAQHKLGPQLKLPDTVLTSAKQDWGALTGIIGNSLHKIVDSASTSVHLVIGSLKTLKDGSGRIVSTISDTMKDVFRKAWDVVKNVFRSGGDKSLDVLKSMANPVRQIVGSISDVLRREFSDAWDKVKHAFKDGTSDSLRLVKDLSSPLRQVADQIGDGLKRIFGKAWDSITQIFKSGTKAVGGVFHGFAAGIRDLMGGIRNGFRALMHVVKVAAAFIKDAVNAIVKAVGRAKDAISGDLPSLPSLPDIPGVHVPSFQTGGTLVPGSGSGDKVPAMLEPGEVVVNREAVKKMGGARRVDLLNKAMPRFGGAPGYAVGGLVGVQPEEKALATYLVEHFGGYISSGLRAGDTGSFHSQGLAADWVGGNWGAASKYVNSVGASLLEGIYNPGSHGGSAVSWDSGNQVSPSFWGASTWAEHLTHIHTATSKAVKGALAGIAEKIPPIKIKGEGMLPTIAQGAADTMRGAANSFIATLAPTQSGKTGPIGAPVKGAIKVGQTIGGKVSYFGEGSGAYSYGPVPGVALNPWPPGGWDDPRITSLAGHDWRIKIGSHEATLPLIDKGPAIDGRVIDVGTQALGKLGFSSGDFPTDSYGTATLLNQLGGIVPGFQEGGMLKAHTGGRFNSIAEFVRALQGKSAREMGDPTRRFTKQIKGMDIPDDLRKKMQDENWQMFLDDDYIARIQQMYGSDNVTNKLGGKTQPQWMQTEAGQMLNMATKLIPQAQRKVKDMVQKLHDKFEKDLKQWAREFKQRIRQAEHDRINKIQRIAPLVDKKYSEIKDMSAQQLHALAEARLKDFPQKSVLAEELANKVADIDKAQINRHGILSVLTGNSDGDIKKGSGGIWGVLEGEIKHLGGLGIKGKGKYDPQSFDSLLSSIWGLGPIGATGGATSYGGDLGTLLSDLATLVPPPSSQPSIPADWKKRMQGIGIGEHAIQKLLALITMTETAQQEPWSPGGSNLTPKELILQLSENKDLAATYGLQAHRIGDLESILKAALPGTGTLQKDFLTGAIPNLQSALQTIVGIIPGAGALGATQEHIKSLKFQLDELIHPDPANQLLEAIEAHISLAELTKGPGAPGGPTGLDDDIFWTGKLVDYWTKALAEAMAATPRNWATIGADASSLAGAKDSLESLIQSRTDAGTGAGTAAVDAARADLLAQQLLAAQQALIVSQSQYSIFSQFSGLFAKGGTIPPGMWGIAGESGPEVISGPASVYASQAKKVPIVYASGEAAKLAKAIGKELRGGVGGRTALAATTAGAAGTTGIMLPGGIPYAGSTWEEVLAARAANHPGTDFSNDPEGYDIKQQPWYMDYLRKFWAGVAASTYGNMSPSGASGPGLQAALTSTTYSSTSGIDLTQRTIDKTAKAIAKAMGVTAGGTAAAMSAMRANNYESGNSDVYHYGVVAGFTDFGTYQVPTYLLNNPTAFQHYLDLIGVTGGLPPGYANGGFIPAGKRGIVGERGPEIATGPAMIHPMGQPVIEVHINGTDLSEFVDVKVRGANERNISYARRRS